jgi:hypothetical protein
VLVEIVWVLRKAYKYDRASVGDVIERILATNELRVEDRDAAAAALAAYRTSVADYADCLLGLLNRDLGCATTVTFDCRRGDSSGIPGAVSRECPPRCRAFTAQIRALSPRIEALRVSHVPNLHIVMSLIPLPDFLMHGVVLHFSCFRVPARLLRKYVSRETSRHCFT